MSGRAFVLGAGGAVGEAAALALSAAGWRVTASVHRRRENAEARLAAAGAAVVVHDLAAGDWRADAEGADAWVLTPHLERVAPALAGVAAPGRLVVFSSNNVAADAEAAGSRALAACEQRLRTQFPDIAIIRPTLIFGDPRLATLTRIVALAQRWRIMPLPGAGRARMQPVFHADLGELAARLAAPGAPSGVFAAGGPDVVSLRELYALVLRATGRRALVVPIPRMLLKLAAPSLAARGLLSEEQIARADADRVAVEQDRLPAGWAPRTPLKEGLARLAAALRASAATLGGA